MVDSDVVPVPAATAGAAGAEAAKVGAGAMPRYDLQTLQALRRIVRAIDLHSHKLAYGYNITTPQLCCLLAVKEHQPINQRKIAERVHLSPSTMVGILDRLEEKKLVRRQRDTKDRRLIWVKLTATGESLVAQAPSPLQDRLAAALKALPETEQRTITASLQRVVELMEATHIDAAPMLETGSLIGSASPLRALAAQTPPAGVPAPPAPVAGSPATGVADPVARPLAPPADDADALP